MPQPNTSLNMVMEMVAKHKYNGDLAPTKLTTIKAATNGWVKITGSAVMPARTAKLRLQIRFPKLYGTVFIDDLSLQ